MKKYNIIGYRFADGVHWNVDGKEVAIIDESTNEIEWCVRKNYLSNEVIDIIKSKRNRPAASFTFDVKRISHSATQGSIRIELNGKEMITFGDHIELIDGKWQSTIPDEELGRYVYGLLYHPYDDIYHYSDKVKDYLKPDWNK